MFSALRGGTPKAPEGAAGEADAAPVSKPVDPLLSSEPATPLSTATVSATPASQASVLSSAGRGAGGAGASAGLKPGDVVVFSDIATGTIYRAAAGASSSAAGAGAVIRFTPGSGAAKRPGLEGGDSADSTPAANSLAGAEHAAAELEVVSRHGYIGFKHRATGRFLQARRGGRERLGLYSFKCGVWEQWALVGLGADGATPAGADRTWVDTALVLSPRQLPAFRLNIHVTRVEQAPLGAGASRFRSAAAALAAFPTLRGGSNAASPAPSIPASIPESAVSTPAKEPVGGEAANAPPTGARWRAALAGTQRGEASLNAEKLLQGGFVRQTVKFLENEVRSRKAQSELVAGHTRELNALRASVATQLQGVREDALQELVRMRLALARMEQQLAETRRLALAQAAQAERARERGWAALRARAGRELCRTALAAWLAGVQQAKEMEVSATEMGTLTVIATLRKLFTTWAAQAANRRAVRLAVQRLLRGTRRRAFERWAHEAQTGKAERARLAGVGARAARRLARLGECNAFCAWRAAAAREAAARGRLRKAARFWTRSCETGAFAGWRAATRARRGLRAAAAKISRAHVAYGTRSAFRAWSGAAREAGRARLQNGTYMQRAALEALFARRNASAAQRAIGEILNAWGEAAARETSLRRRMARALTRMANVRLHAAFRAIREVRVTCGGSLVHLSEFGSRADGCCHRSGSWPSYRPNLNGITTQE